MTRCCFPFLRFRSLPAALAFCLFLGGTLACGKKTLAPTYGHRSGDFSHVEQRSVRQKLQSFFEEGVEKPLPVNGHGPEDLLRVARRYEGTPHCMGGASRRCMDCSGLLVASFRELGVSLPHNSQAIARYGKMVVAPAALRPGDLVFFVRTYRTDKVITHAGIYTGSGKFLHTSSSDGVRRSNIDDPYYWGERYVFGTRVW
jgi:cell wall-associated NlpC family hydrolase